MKTKSTKIKIAKLIITALLLFTNINNISAMGKAYTTEEVTGTTDITMNKSDYEKQSFIVCSYACATENAGYEEGKCGREGVSFSGIYYSAEEARKWEIRTNIYLTAINLTPKQQKMDDITDIRNYEIFPNRIEMNITKFIYKDIGSIIPTGGIYYENPTGNNLEENWGDTEQYNTLKTNFTCPQYMYYDHTVKLSYDHLIEWPTDLGEELAKKITAELQDETDNSMELCYANEKEKCMKRDAELKKSFFGKIKQEEKTFGKANNLNYSLTQELNSMINDTNIELINMDAKTILERSFATKNDICEALENKMYKELINTSTYEVMLNEIFQSKISSSSPNKNLMDVEHLEKLLIPNKGYNSKLNLMYNSTSLSEKYVELQDAYAKKLTESIEYYANECHVNNDLISGEKLTELAKTEINKIVADKTELDKTEFDCDTLFADMADIIKYAYFVLEIIAILIVVIQTGLDYSKVFLSDDKDQLKKSNDKLIKRIIVLIVILLLPALTNFFLKLFKIEGFNSENPLCVEIKQSKKN